MARLHTMTCAECGSRFEAVRADAERCSGRCRERARKARAEARRAAEIERAVEVLAAMRAAALAFPED